MAIRSKFKADPGTVYAVWQPFSVEVDGTPYTFARGERIRGDHPVVAKVGAQALVDDEVMEREWPTSFDEIVAADAKAQHAAPSPAPLRIDPNTKLADLVVCVQDVLASVAGSCGTGDIHLTSDPIVAAAPAAFRPLAEAL